MTYNHHIHSYYTIISEDSDDDLNVDDDEFHFASDQLPTTPSQPARLAPSSTFQFSSNPEPSRNIRAQQPIQPVLPFLQQHQPRPVPTQPRPEFIEIHKTPAQLTAQSYLPETEVTCELCLTRK